MGHAYFHVTWGQWLANLFIAAPMLGQPYMDDAYWSLVIEVVFYVWIALFLAWGIFPRRIDTLIIVWIAITFANELTLDVPLFEKLFMADDSGFFAVGLLIYEHYRGRRDMRLYSLLTLAIGTATFQAVHKLERLGVHTGGSFDPRVVTATCIVSLGIVFAATRIKSVALPESLIRAVGGITYPLYLLHLQLGYVILLLITPTPDVLSTALVVTGMVVLAWFVWRFLEGPVHYLVRDKLTLLASRHGWPSRLRAGEARIDRDDVARQSRPGASPTADQSGAHRRNSIHPTLPPPRTVGGSEHHHSSAMRGDDGRADGAGRLGILRPARSIHDLRAFPLPAHSPARALP
ncbi:acyltransferase family protein [Bradyrhizobium sp. BR 1433]|uniref:acyltransferase family protein n=1 Tax=Bradyrhizobium sp. BR 1433 TaxID=3447967 RepID=UPI003EE66864